MCINIINVAVISINIVNSDAKPFKNRLTMSNVSVVKARGSGRVGGFGIFSSNLFLVFRYLTSFRKRGGDLGGSVSASGYGSLFLRG